MEHPRSARRFYASPLFPRLLDPESIRDTIARGVSNGQIAYVGKAPNGKYLPFNFERTITAFEVEISEEMYIITKETAEAYRAQPAPPHPPQPSIPGLDVVGAPSFQPTPSKPGSSGGAEPSVRRL